MAIVTLTATGAGVNNGMTIQGGDTAANTYNSLGDDNKFFNVASAATRSLAMDDLPGDAQVVITHTVYYKQRHNGVLSAFGSGMIRIGGVNYNGTSREYTGNPGTHATNSDTDLRPGSMPTIAEVNDGEAGFVWLSGDNDIQSTYGKWDVTYEGASSFIHFWKWLPPLLSSNLFGNYLFQEDKTLLHRVFCEIIKATGYRIVPALKVHEDEMRSLIQAMVKRPRFVFQRSY